MLFILGMFILPWVLSRCDAHSYLYTTSEPAMSAFTNPSLNPLPPSLLWHCHQVADNVLKPLGDTQRGVVLNAIGEGIYDRSSRVVLQEFVYLFPSHPRYLFPSHPRYLYPRTPDIHTLAPQIFASLVLLFLGHMSGIPGYSHPCTPDIHTLVPRIFTPSYPGYSHPRTRIFTPSHPGNSSYPDIPTLVPRIFTPDIHTVVPGYSPPRTPDIHFLVPRIFTPDMHRIAPSNSGDFYSDVDFNVGLTISVRS